MRQSLLAEALEARVLLSGVISFAPPAVYSVTQSGARSVAVGDFNHDGFADMAVANPDNNTVTVFLNRGNGTFAAQPSIRIADPVQVVAGHFVSSTSVDLVVLSGVLPTTEGNLAGNRTSSDSIAILAGNGDGKFVIGARYKVIQGDHRMIASDLNRDGLTDLVISTERGVGVILNPGGGNLAPEVPYTTSNSLPSFLIASDLNGDGFPDLAVALGTFKAVRILLNNGAGGFTVGTAYHVNGNAVSLAAADFTGDGKVDLAVAGNGYRQGIQILRGKGDGTFSKGPINRAGAFLQSVVAADFNGDGAPDLAAVDFTSSVRVAAGNGNGTFSKFAILLGGTEAFEVSTADLNNDAKPDIVLLRHGGVYVYLNTSG